jgi:hypothetical protein
MALIQSILNLEPYFIYQNYSKENRPIQIWDSKRFYHLKKNENILRMRKLYELKKIISHKNL